MGILRKISPSWSNISKHFFKNCSGSVECSNTWDATILLNFLSSSIWGNLDLRYCSFSFNTNGTSLNISTNVVFFLEIGFVDGPISNVSIFFLESINLENIRWCSSHIFPTASEWTSEYPISSKLASVKINSHEVHWKTLKEINLSWLFSCFVQPKTNGASKILNFFIALSFLQKKHNFLTSNSRILISII